MKVKVLVGNEAGDGSKSNGTQAIQSIRPKKRHWDRLIYTMIDELKVNTVNSHNVSTKNCIKLWDGNVPVTLSMKLIISQYKYVQWNLSKMVTV